MEKQLAEYRAKKARERKSASNDSSLQTVFKSIMPSLLSKQNEKSTMQEASSSPQVPTSSQNSSSTRPETIHSRTASVVHSNTHILLHPTFLKTVLWLILWGLFLELGFGAVYFVISLLIIVYRSTRTGPSTRLNGPSAYSVFNPNCERLDGTFTAEQFERELRYGAGSVE